MVAKLGEDLLHKIPGQLLNYSVCSEMRKVVFEPSTNELLGCKRDKEVKRATRSVTVQKKVNELEASMLAFSEDF